MTATFKRKRYPHGKYFICSQGNPEYKAIAEKAFVASIEAHPQLNNETFLALMRSSGVPEDDINEYLVNHNIENQIHSEDHPEMECLIGLQTSMKVVKQS